jgi:hypothetical protein
MKDGHKKIVGSLIIMMSIFLGLASVDQALAADLYVRAGADGQGSKEAPFGLLWKAMDKAVRGDVIHVAKGIYEGKGGSGAYLVTVPNLTIVGGYTPDFASRDPFTHLTVLQRAADYKGDWTGLKEGILEGKEGVDHSGLIVDGLVLNSQSRNDYKTNGDINAQKSWKGTLFQASRQNIKIRNCILLNPYGEGIYAAWAGKDNEVSNCFVLNTFYDGISTRSAQPDAVVTVKNCTVLFSWDQPGKGGGMAVFVGRQGQTILQNNIFGFGQAHAVTNGFGNEDTIMKNNIFFQCQQGYYKYMDGDGRNLLVWKADELKGLNGDPESYMLKAAEGNLDSDPKLKPDKDYFEKFSNFVASEPGKLNMDMMNEWRRSVGLPLQAEPGSPRKNWGMAYPLSAVIPNLVSPIADRGVQVKGPFQEYHSNASPATASATASSATGSAETAGNFAETPFDGFNKGAAGCKELAGKAVAVKAGMGQSATTWLLKDAPRENYLCVKLLAPGETDMTRNYLFGYILKGSDVNKDWEKLAKKRDKYNATGLMFKGKAWYLGNDNYPFPVGLIIESIVPIE